MFLDSLRYYSEISPSTCPVCPTTAKCGINVIASCLVRQSQFSSWSVNEAFPTTGKLSPAYLHDRDCITSMSDS